MSEFIFRNEDKRKRKWKKRELAREKDGNFRDYNNRVLVNLWNGVIGLGDHRSS